MATSQTSGIVQTVIGEASRLRDFLSGLDAQTWASDSTCEGWTIEDVVSILPVTPVAGPVTSPGPSPATPDPRKGRLSCRPESGHLIRPAQTPGSPAGNRGHNCWTPSSRGTTVSERYC